MNAFSLKLRQNKYKYGAHEKNLSNLHYYSKDLILPFFFEFDGVDELVEGKIKYKVRTMRTRDELYYRKTSSACFIDIKK